MAIIKYVHHGKEVSVRGDLKGKHWDHCLCATCEKLNTEDPDVNCPVACELFQLCVRHDLVSPVWECPNYKAKNGNQ